MGKVKNNHINHLDKIVKIIQTKKIVYIFNKRFSSILYKQKRIGKKFIYKIYESTKSKITDGWLILLLDCKHSQVVSLCHQ